MLYLVCDGGGTKTDFLLFESSGRVRARAFGTAANANFIPVEEAVQTVAAGIDSCLAEAGIAISQVKTVVLFIPGFKAAMPAMEKRYPKTDIRQLGDEYNAFYAALGQPLGIAVLSGTGSFAVGKTKSGQFASAGGWGPLFGDEGSGYHIGLLCLSRLARRHDGGEDGRILEGLALQTLKLPQVSALRKAAYQPEFTHRRIAQLSHAVAEAARLNDPDAKEILDTAAAALAGLAATVARRLQCEDLPVALTGGVTNMGELFVGRFIKALQRELPRAVYTPAKYRPIEGAALYVLHEMAGIDITDQKVLFNLTEAKEGDTYVNG